VETKRKELKQGVPDMFSLFDWNDTCGFANFVVDKERRARMIYDWARRKQFVRTGCCSYEICFHCHGAPHEGTSCADFRNELGYSDELDIRVCPHCHLTLERTDGCSSINCFCGEYFDWDAEGAEAETNNNNNNNNNGSEEVSTDAEVEEETHVAAATSSSLSATQEASIASASSAQRAGVDDARALSSSVARLPLLPLSDGTLSTEKPAILNNNSITNENENDTSTKSGIISWMLSSVNSVTPAISLSRSVSQKSSSSITSEA